MVKLIVEEGGELPEGAVVENRIEKDTVFANPGDATLNGKKFLEWRKQGETTAYDFTQLVTEDLILEAHFRANTIAEAKELGEVSTYDVYVQSVVTGLDP